VVVGLSVVGGAVVVVAADVGSGVAAPAGRQIDRPGYSGVFDVAPFAPSRSATSTPARLAMPSQ